MKFATVFVASSICAVDAGLSTMRVGPRKLARDEVGIEFGRVVNLREMDAAFQEENVAHMRFLHDTSYGMDSSISFSYTGMSLMYSSMSLPYSGMSLTMKVEIEPSDDIVKLLTDGDVVIADIIPESEHQSNVIDVPVGLTTSTGESQELPQESFDSTYRTVFIAVMATLVVLALAMIAIVVYRKKRATRVISNCEDRSKCETSTVSGVDINAQETKGSAV
ncbi:hypothetical protein MHU86_10914 [Fragilaria crotonensis]|nr:hypothetical protein MHU86_10914 [Fragilaria crotonensis]